jgi:hypothetical protein
LCVPHPLPESFPVCSTYRFPIIIYSLQQDLFGSCLQDEQYKISTIYIITMVSQMTLHPAPPYGKGKSHFPSNTLASWTVAGTRALQRGPGSEQGRLALHVVPLTQLCCLLPGRVAQHSFPDGAEPERALLTSRSASGNAFFFLSYFGDQGE